MRAIRIARRRLIEGQLAGAGGEGRGQLPKYVVVISGTDLENVGGDDVWLEDDDQNEPWESFAKSFSRVSAEKALHVRFLAHLLTLSILQQGQHCTTLFSLISLGHTPHLEGFWKEVRDRRLLFPSQKLRPPPRTQCSGRFPANLIYTSLAPPPNVAFSFPLVSPSHACFLLGFYNNNRQQPPPSAAAANGTSQTNSAKRPTPPEPNMPNKKAKPNPTAQPAQVAGKGQTPIPPPKPTRTPSSASGTVPQAVKPSPSQVNSAENVQQYLNDVKANGGRSSQPFQANGTFATGSQGTPRGRHAATPTSATQGLQTPNLPQGQQGLPNQPVAPLPQIPPEMRAKVEAHLETIRTRVQRGQLSQEQAAQQIRQLQELTNQ